MTIDDEFLLPAREAYDLAAAEYDHWQWQNVWRKIEAPHIANEVRKGPAGAILDLGTGTGFYAASLAEAGLTVVGLDISLQMLLLAQSFMQHRVPLVQASAAQIPFRNETFSQVIAARVLSQIDEVDRVFGEVSRILKPGGAFIVSEVDPAHPYRATALPLGGRKIRVRTFKRTRASLIRRARSFGSFYVSDQIWIRTRDLKDEDNMLEPASLDTTQDLPLAFVLRLVRT